MGELRANVKEALRVLALEEFDGMPGMADSGSFDRSLGNLGRGRGYSQIVGSNLAEERCQQKFSSLIRSHEPVMALY